MRESDFSCVYYLGTSMLTQNAIPHKERLALREGKRGLIGGEIRYAGKNTPAHARPV